jgi:hypothetical protein
LHYADKFKFRHIPFLAPFDPLSYLDALKHCVKKGAKTVIIDSTSHLHEGPGGTLEEHSEEQERLAKLWKSSLDAVNMAAWNKPKQKLRAFLNEMLQLNINIIFCFRAKEKVDMAHGGKPVNKGFQPIIGDEFFYEMTVNFLLYPNSNGMPTWTPGEKAEGSVIKLPTQFRDIFKENRQLDESIGMELAKWSSGSSMAKKQEPTPASQPIAQTKEQSPDLQLDRIADEGFELSGEPPVIKSNKDIMLGAMKKYQSEKIVPVEKEALCDSLIIWLERGKDHEEDKDRWPKAISLLKRIEATVPIEFRYVHTLY